LNGEPRWRPFTTFEVISDSAEVAELQARAAIGWFGLMRELPPDGRETPASVT
jgi:hypothetical protein